MGTTASSKTIKFDTRDGYASVTRHLSGAIDVEYFDHYGRPHREDGPADVYRSAQGQVYHYAFYIHGESHRVDGPAIMWKNVAENGLNTFRAGETFFINGKYIPSECADLWLMFLRDPKEDNLESVLFQLSMVRPDITQDWWRRLAYGDI